MSESVGYLLRFIARKVADRERLVFNGDRKSGSASRTMARVERYLRQVQISQRI